MIPLIRLLGSLRVAVPLLIAIAGVLAYGTIYETNYGTASVQRFVYRAWWFQALLAFLAVNLAIAAFQRYPWKKRHTPFLLAHLGIILILTGGIIGGRFGIEGQLIIPEGQTERVLQTYQHVLAVRQANPGVPHLIPTNFETQAWVHEPRKRIRVPLEQRVIELTVERYLPNAQVSERVSEHGQRDNPAIRIRMSAEDHEDAVWLFAHDQERFAIGWREAHLLFLEPATPELFERLLSASPAEAAAASRGTVVIELTALGLRREIPVPEDLGHPVPVEGTPYRVTFKEHFTDFAITEQGVVNRSPEPNNPAVALTLSGPEGEDPILAFALHPDFAMSHLRQPTIPARVTYVHGGRPSLPEHSLAVLRHPGGALSCVMTGPAGEAHPLACEPGGTYRHVSLGYDLTLEAYYPRAVIEQEFVNRDNEVKAEALHITVRDGEKSAQAWVPLGGSAEFPVSDDPIIVEYRAAQRELPVTIKLLDFRKIDYPGTDMAQGFESDVQLNDPRRGLLLMRTISMNNPLRYGGYSFYQSSYIPGPTQTTVLSVRNDPGTPVVYAGFLTVIAGVVLLFGFRDWFARAPARPTAGDVKEAR